MSILMPLKFQQEAIDKLKVHFVNLWATEYRKIPFVFKSPTGSGKTFMMACFVNELNQMPNWDRDKAFIWITFSDDLAMQSRDKFVEYFENTLKNDLLTVSDINNGKLKKNDILFVNWQKLVSKAAKNRVLRRPEETEFQKESGYYFEDFIDGTHNDDREIVLIIDEAHKNSTTSLAQDIIDYINPKIILKVSATPDEVPPYDDVCENRAGYVYTKREDVVAEGLIKEKVVVQSEDDLKSHRGEDLDELLLDLGFQRRLELKEQFEELGKTVNPLVLIQLPNDDKTLRERGEQTKEEVVLDYLRAKGVDIDAKVALWFDKYKKNLEFISDNDSDIEFMLFKQAAGTGWDCPRAHVLVMFREITSPHFYVQTVGRILRMAEPSSKEDFRNNPDLRTGYLFTNYKRDEVSIPDQSPNNKPFTQSATLRKALNDDVQYFELQSAYISRVDYGDLADSVKFQRSFLKSMNGYFNLTDDDILNKLNDKLKANGLDLKPEITNSIIVDAEYEDYDQLQLDFQSKGSDLTFEMSHNDVEKTFNYLCYKLLTEQTDDDAKITNVARSWNRLKSALRVWFKQVLGNDSYYYYKVFIADVLKGASSIFRPALTQSLKDYRPILNKVLKARQKKQDKKEAPVFRIKDVYDYTDDFEEVNQNRCVLDKYFIRKQYDGKQNELDFMKYLDSKKESVYWWFKNGDSGKEYYSLRYYNVAEQTERLFYPDWIIRFSDGRTGIFDTKRGRTLNTEGRAKGLALKLKELGDNYVGGIVKEANGIYEYCCSRDYDDRAEANNMWEPMESFFNGQK